MKRCFKCKTVKPLGEFYANPGMLDGHVNRCKECTRAAIAADRVARPEAFAERDRLRNMSPHRVVARKVYRATPAGVAGRLSTVARYRRNNPEKYQAHAAVQGALRSGRLVKKVCEKCGAVTVEAHHEDYSKPLEVRWLCNPHHREADKERVEIECKNRQTK